MILQVILGFSEDLRRHGHPNTLNLFEALTLQKTFCFDKVKQIEPVSKKSPRGPTFHGPLTKP